MFILDELCFTPPFRVTARSLRTSAEAKNAFALVAEENGRMDGFIILNRLHCDHEQVSYVTTLDVHPEARGRGLGRTLMELAEQHAREAGDHAMMLHVFTENHAALRLYARLGFEPYAHAPNFYRTGFDAWVYRKVLSGAQG